MTSTELFAAMPARVAHEILDYCHAHEKQLYRTALDAVAQVRKLRSVYLERLPRAERYGLLAESLRLPGLMAGADGLIRTWLLKQHTGLLKDFLDALQIKHEDGVVEGLPATVPDDVLRNAVNTLLERHPAEAVAIYLHAFNSMNGEQWTNLDALVREEPRLQWRREE
jgi:hypothetical protein